MIYICSLCDRFYQPHRLTPLGQVWRCASFPPEPESAALPGTTPWHSTCCLPSCILTPFCLLVWLPAGLGFSHVAHCMGGTDMFGVLVFLTHHVISPSEKPVSPEVLFLFLSSPSEHTAPLSASDLKPGGWEPLDSLLSLFPPPRLSPQPSLPSTCTPSPPTSLHRLCYCHFSPGGWYGRL